MRIAVVLFNLGGPDSPEAVRPFLTNLFSDPAIIGAPGFVRWPLARFIAWRRAPVAREIYAQIGGASPILGQTESQAAALEAALGDDHVWRAFVCMRYWHPMTEAVVRDVRAFKPDRVVLLPLYPQLSTSTSESSVKAWHEEAARQGLKAPTRAVCCYPVEDGFVAASADLLRGELAGMGDGKRRVLFSAHGLPEKIVQRGDPYPAQVERTALAIAAALGLAREDWAVCYQSRVGPLKWIGPSTEDEIRRAGREGRGLAVYPLAFVSEHSETLVELDIEYRELAEHASVPIYRRVPTVGTHPLFIAGLARLARAALAGEAAKPCNDGDVADCGAPHRRCPRFVSLPAWQGADA
ncbi:MAG: ferrochelatase [Alphaproteobacteria bacterium]|nr:ferrochelatase [Alphaproteobacteria bacterium]